MPTKNDLNDLIDEGLGCFDKLEAYVERLNHMVGGAIQKAVKTNSDKELQQIRFGIELNNQAAGRLRMNLKTQELRMVGLISGIDKTLKEMDKIPKSAFIQGVSKIKKATKGKALEGLTIDPVGHLSQKELKGPIFPEREDIECPHCRQLNTNFKLGDACIHCHELIGVPWKEHTVCPHCEKITNTRSIRTDPEGYSLNHGMVICPFCKNEFEYKKYISGPQAYSLKICAYCDKSFIPNKQNWRTQRTCSTQCKNALYRAENSKK